MGKLGARELNVSSDIDLIYVYEEDGQTDGARRGQRPRILRAGRASSLYTLIGDITEDGFVFRVDLALRPNGNSGPPVVSLAMLEEYLQVQGREWERFAWLKSRVVAPAAASGTAARSRCAALVTAFVYRRYLDYGVFEGLRQLHGKVRDEAQRRAAGRPERANDVKLSRGGIREIEFIVQLLLVVRGGQFPEIRTRSTLKALTRLAAGGLMKPANAARLAEAYTFLRRVEHRIQYLDDQQTHLLPTADADLAWIARSLGLAAAATPTPANCSTGSARRASSSPPSSTRCCTTAAPPRQHRATAPAAPAARRRCRSTARPSSNSCRRNSRRACAAGASSRASGAARREQAAPGAAGAARRAGGARRRTARWTRRSASSTGSSRCCAARATSRCWSSGPRCRRRLLRLLGLARWPMRYLMQHPGVIDELADERLLHGRFDAGRLHRRARRAPRGLAALRRGRRGSAARHAAPRPPCRGLPHAGARRRGPHHGRAGRRRPVGAGRRDARLRAALGLEAPEAGAPRRAAVSRSSPTASSAARSSATAATSTSCSSTTTATSPTPTAPPRSTAPSCAS